MKKHIRHPLICPFMLITLVPLWYMLFHLSTNIMFDSCCSGGWKHHDSKWMIIERRILISCLDSDCNVQSNLWDRDHKYQEPQLHLKSHEDLVDVFNCIDQLPQVVDKMINEPILTRPNVKKNENRLRLLFNIIKCMNLYVTTTTWCRTRIIYALSGTGHFVTILYNGASKYRLPHFQPLPQKGILDQSIIFHVISIRHMECEPFVSNIVSRIGEACHSLELLFWIQMNIWEVQASCYHTA